MSRAHNEDWLDIVRREAGIVASRNSAPTILVATGYDPDTHAVKGMLMPHNVESGWVALPVHHSGNGWGIAVGPQVGTAEDLKGDMFHIAFLAGDTNVPIAINRHFVVDQNNKPPRVESGEILAKHQSGQSLFYDKSGNATYTGSQGQTITQDSGGNCTVALSGGNKMDLKSGGDAILVDKDGNGIVKCTGGKVKIGDPDASIKVLTIAGPAKNVFATI